MTRECTCTAKPLAIGNKFVIVIPGRINLFHVTVQLLLDATAQDFAFSSHLYSIGVALSTSFCRSWALRSPQWPGFLICANVLSLGVSLSVTNCSWSLFIVRFLSSDLFLSSDRCYWRDAFLYGRVSQLADL